MATESPGSVSAPTQIVWVPTDKVQAHPDNVRGANLGALEELKASIASRGLLQVPTVTWDEPQDVYTIITGHRRIQAMREMGVASIPVVVKEKADAASDLADMLVENLQREALTPMQEARALAHLVNLGWKQSLVAKQIGRTQPHVSRRVKLLELPVEIQEAIDAGGISVNDATYLFPLIGDEALILRVFHNRDRGTIQNLVLQAQNAQKRAAERGADPDKPERSEDEVKAAKDAASRRRALNRQARQATEARSTLISSLIKQRIAKTRVAEFTLTQLMVNTPTSVLEVAYPMLGIQKVERKNGFGQVWDVDSYIAVNAEENVHRLGYAIALIQGHLALSESKDQLSGTSLHLAQTTLDHLNLSAGYEPTSAELYMVGKAEFEVAPDPEAAPDGQGIPVVSTVKLNWTFCPECKGEGEIEGKACEACGGSGMVPLSEESAE